jgi:pilus assembly protein Flp/PilA
MKNLLNRLWLDEEGQDLTEYALLLALVALGAIGAMNSLATTINSVLNAAATKLGSAPGS